MKNVKHLEFLPAERAALAELRRRLNAASGALEQAFLRRQYAQAVAHLETKGRAAGASAP